MSLELLELQPISDLFSSNQEFRVYVFLKCIYTLMYIYIYDCIYTYKHNIIVLRTRLLKSTERISHQPLWYTDLCHFLAA